ncbi:MAG: hypothetical protein HGA49_10180 [Eubacteriaceae bacterium]|nr:hypothetical protein [Eubacteriaceae bacterium]
MLKYAEFVSCCSRVTQQKRFYELIDEFVKTEKFEYRSERFVLNVSASQVAKLSTKGLQPIKDQPRYRELYPEFLERIQ